MENEKIFTEGLIFKLPRQNAPDFVKGSVSIKADEFVEFIKKHQKNGWLNIDLKVSQGGKAYAELNSWEPNAASNNGPVKSSSNGEIPTKDPEDMDVSSIPF